jgi:hypothetical protein
MRYVNPPSPIPSFPPPSYIVPKLGGGLFFFFFSARNILDAVNECIIGFEYGEIYLELRVGVGIGYNEFYFQFIISRNFFEFWAGFFSYLI